MSAFDHAAQQLKEAGKRLRQFAKEVPAREQEARALLKSVPGVGELTAEVVLSEWGTWRCESTDATFLHTSRQGMAHFRP